VIVPRTTRTVTTCAAGTCARECGEGDNRAAWTPSDTDRVVIMLGITRLAVARCKFVVHQPHDVTQFADHKCTTAAQTTCALSRCLPNLLSPATSNIGHPETNKRLDQAPRPIVNMPIGQQESGVTSGVKFVTSTVGNTVGGVTNTLGGVVGALGRGIGETVN
jgi:hypothetical protein